MQLNLYQIDAFTDKTFAGNPAVVCLLDNNDDLSEDTKQKIAAEVNQPMIAFVSRKWTQNSLDSDKIHYKIQFFTPTQEFYLCGHATLATILLLNSMDKSIKNYTFETKAGEQLGASIDDKQWITISLPLPTPNRLIPLDDKWTQNIIALTLGSKLDINCVKEVAIANKFVLIRLNDSDDIDLYAVDPDFVALNQIQEDQRKGVRNGIIVTQKGDYPRDGFHFYSRVFLPWIGVNEDPVCGSAHTQLMPYWSETLSAPVGQVLFGKQVSQRTGVIGCRLSDQSVELSGNAVFVWKGIISL